MSNLFKYLYNYNNLLLANRPYGNRIIINTIQNNKFITFKNKEFKYTVSSISNKQNTIAALSKLIYILYDKIKLYIYGDDISFIVNKNYNDGLLNLEDIKKINNENSKCDEYDYAISISPHTNVVYKKICNTNMYIEHRFESQYTLIYLDNVGYRFYFWNTGAVEYYNN